MKKIIAMITVLGAFTLLFTSCAKDEINEAENELGATTTYYESDSVTGLKAEIFTDGSIQYECYTNYEWDYGVNKNEACNDNDNGNEPTEYGRITNAYYYKDGDRKDGSRFLYDRPKSRRNLNNIMEFVCKEVNGKMTPCYQNVTCEYGTQTESVDGYTISHCKEEVIVPEDSWETGQDNAIYNKNIDNVGIGKNNPAEKLDIQGDANMSGTVKIGDTADSDHKCSQGQINGALRYRKSTGKLQGCANNEWVDLTN